MSEKKYIPIQNILPPIECHWSVGVYLERFYQDLEKKKFTGITCPKCKKVYLPPRKFCAECGSETKKFTPVKKTGKLVNYTTAFQNVNGGRREAPLIIGLVKLDGADTAIYGEVRPNGVGIKTGMKVKAVFADKPGNTVESLSHFEPAK